MFEFYILRKDAISLLKKEHYKLKELFEQFDTAEAAEKHKIALRAINEFKLHTAIKEQVFYPAIRPYILGDIMHQADEEHHIARLLMAELEDMTGREEHYTAKFKVFSEYVCHQLREENMRMMPRANELGIDMEALGRKMLSRRKYLSKAGVLPSAEEKMFALIKKSIPRKPSQAKAARMRKQQLKARPQRKLRQQTLSL